jgi:hypothetical protein
MGQCSGMTPESDDRWRVVEVLAEPWRVLRCDSNSRERSGNGAPYIDPHRVVRKRTDEVAVLGFPGVEPLQRVGRPELRDRLAFDRICRVH